MDPVPHFSVVFVTANRRRERAQAVNPVEYNESLAVTDLTDWQKYVHYTDICIIQGTSMNNIISLISPAFRYIA
jgi:hypothetical protein